MKKYLLIIFIYSIFLGCSEESEIEDDPISIDMNQVLDDLVTNNSSIPSVSMIAVKDGEIIYQHGAGFFDDAGVKEPNDKTIYTASSLSKLIIAVAVMQQVEKGNLNINEDISDYIGFSIRNPNFPDEVITSKMLMQHASSLSNPRVGEVVDELLFGYKLDSVIQFHPTIENAITPGSSIYKSGIWPNIKPGSLHKNSNYGLVLLAYLVEKLSGENFTDYCKMNVFEPLGMNSTSHYYPDLDANIISDTYIPKGTLLPPVAFFFYPTGRMYTSKMDWAKFMNAILNEGRLNGNQILQKSSIDAMLDLTTPTNNQLAYNSNIGLIWREAPVNTGWVGHTGEGFAAHITEMNLENRIGYVVFSNRGGNSSLIGPDSDLNTTIHEWLEQQIQ